MFVSPFALALVLSLAAFQAAGARPVHFVKASASNGGNVLSWATDYNKLQDALAAAQPGEDVWLASGTYFPDLGTNQTDNDRFATFAL